MLLFFMEIEENLFLDINKAKYMINDKIIGKKT